VVELCAQYKAVWAALETRNKQMEEEQAQAEVKRAKRANRYRCANVGCSVQADTGRMLAQCAYGPNLRAFESLADIVLFFFFLSVGSGKCDPDKKPSYCSKE
jgi:hypothetical protein